MSWSRIRRLSAQFGAGASLRAKLLALLLPAMLGIAGMSLWATHADAVGSANAAYDRSLLGAIKALDLNVSTASGGLAVELPYRLFEFFQLTATGEVYFRVATADGLVEIGHPDLPRPPRAPRLGEPVFYDARYFGEPVRVGAYVRPLERPVGAAQEVMIQVAESTASRTQFTSRFVRRAAWRDAALLAVLLASVALALWVALRPVSRLARLTAQRAPDDLRPLEAAGLPRDIAPLVEAVNQQLARTDALMTERRRFIDDASHQLRTPLATLRAQVDYALREPDSVRARQALQALSLALDNAVRATNQLLALARSDAAAVQTEPFDAAALARETALALLPQARARGIDLGVEAPADGCPTGGDRALLGQALANLLHNAIHHGRAQGVVTVQVAADALGCSLAVLDDGPGVDADLLPRLSQRFAKGRGSSGSGLGLAIAESVMTRHGGRLRVQARDDGPGLKAVLWWPHP